MDQGMIFCRTKLDCDNLEKFLVSAGDKSISCVCLHGDRKPQERQQNLQKFKVCDNLSPTCSVLKSSAKFLKDRRVNFLICTDVAARGLDVKGLPFMINVSLPDDKSNYVHRIGRVGRAERMGLAISLVSTVQEKVFLPLSCFSFDDKCFLFSYSGLVPRSVVQVTRPQLLEHPRDLGRRLLRVE